MMRIDSTSARLSVWFFLVLVCLVSACGNEGGSPSSESSNPEQPTSTTISITTSTNRPEARTWPAGSTTCAELQSNVPVAVDDFGVSLDNGLLTYRWTDESGNNAEGTIQVYDDPTCAVDTDAWRFLISTGLDVEQLDRNGSVCSLIEALTVDDPPANSQVVLGEIGDLDALTTSCS